MYSMSCRVQKIKCPIYARPRRFPCAYHVFQHLWGDWVTSHRSPKLYEATQSLILCGLPLKICCAKRPYFLCFLTATSLLWYLTTWGIKSGQNLHCCQFRRQEGQQWVKGQLLAMAAKAAPWSTVCVCDWGKPGKEQTALERQCKAMCGLQLPWWDVRGIHWWAMILNGLLLYSFLKNGIGKTHMCA